MLRDSKTIIEGLKNCRSKYGNSNELIDKIQMIEGRMAAEKAVDYSDNEIERCLKPCVAGHVLVPMAKELVKQKLLIWK